MQDRDTKPKSGLLGEKMPALSLDLESSLPFLKNININENHILVHGF